MRSAVIALAIVCCAASSGAEERGLTVKGSERSITLPEVTVTLKEGKGRDLAQSYCAICHSLDYITTQPVFPKAKWQAEVTKMIKVFGAPIDEEKARQIAQYLGEAYGR